MSQKYVNTAIQLRVIKTNLLHQRQNEYLSIKKALQFTSKMCHTDNKE